MREKTDGNTAGQQAGIWQGITIAIAGFFPVLAIVSLAPAVPTFFRHFATVPAASTFVPLLVTAPGLVIALCSPLMGWLADRYGRRRIILIATLFYGLLGTAPFFLQTIVPIFASRLALGFAEAAILTVTNVLIADYFKSDGRRVWLAIQAVIGPVLGFSTTLSSGLLTEWRWNGVFLIYVVAMPMFVAMYAFLFEPTLRNEHRAAGSANKTPFSWRPAAAFIPVTLYAAVLYYVFIVQIGLAYGEIGLSDPGKLGGLLAVASIGVPIGGAAFGFLAKRMPILIVLSIMFAFFGVGLLIIGFSHTTQMMTAGGFVQQIGAGMCVAALIFWVSSLLSPDQRGRGFGVWTGAFFIGQFVSPAIVGPLRAPLGGTLGIFVAAGLASFGGTLLCFLMRSKSSNQASEG